MGDNGNIKKTIIFVDNVEKSIVLEKHLQTFFLDYLKDRNDQVIRSFLSILEAQIKTDWIEDFLNTNAKIITYTNTAEMAVGILDIK